MGYNVLLEQNFWYMKPFFFSVREHSIGIVCLDWSFERRYYRNVIIEFKVITDYPKYIVAKATLKKICRGVHLGVTLADNQRHKKN